MTILSVPKSGLFALHIRGRSMVTVHRAWNMQNEHGGHSGHENTPKVNY